MKSKRKFPYIYLLIIGVIIFIAGFFKYGNFFQKKSEIPSASFILSPLKGKFKSDQVFDLTIILDTKNNLCSAAGAILKFEPDDLEAVKILPENIFGLYPSQKIDNTLGEIKISGVSFNKSQGKPDKPFLGRKAFAKITFKVKPINKEKESQINFEFKAPGITTDSNIMEAKSAKDILREVNNLTVVLIP